MNEAYSLDHAMPKRFPRVCISSGFCRQSRREGSAGLQTGCNADLQTGTCQLTESRGENLPSCRQLGDAAQLREMIQVVPGHGFDHSLEGHCASLGMCMVLPPAAGQRGSNQRRFHLRSALNVSSACAAAVPGYCAAHLS